MTSKYLTCFSQPRLTIPAWQLLLRCSWENLSNRIKWRFLTVLHQKLGKTARRLIKHARYYPMLVAESPLTRGLFGNMVQPGPQGAPALPASAGPGRAANANQTRRRSQRDGGSMRNRPK